MKGAAQTRLWVKNMELSKEWIREALSRALKTGADFSELYFEDAVSQNIQLVSGSIENAVSARNKGVGMRVLKGTRCVYAYGNDLSREGLLSLADSVAAALSGSGNAQDIVLVPHSFERMHPILIPCGKGDIRFKADCLRRAEAAARAYSNEISQVTAGISDIFKQVVIANSDGLYAEDERAYCRFSVSAVASSGSENQSGAESPGAHAGSEFLNSLDFEGLGKSAAKTAVTMLHAPLCPAGIMPVVMDNGFGGVIFHEACGHSLEATSVAKGNSVFCGKLGQQIGSPKVTAYDDGTIPGAWGSLNMNDEGEAPQRIKLLDKGVLTSYMIDKLGSRRMNMPSTGSGRRESYSFAPTSRMTNTFIAAGQDRNEDIIASVEDGLYAAKMGGGSVNPVTCEFNFAVLEGYLIKNGKITTPVRGATLIGRGNEILFNIDMVGTDMTMAQGMCGSESGSIPTNVGQPMIRINKISVGGKS